MDKPGQYRTIQVDRLGRARQPGAGRRGRAAPVIRFDTTYNNGFSSGSGYQPAINIVVPWTPEFGMAYQQFVNGGMGGMGGYPMGGMGGNPMGGMGGYPMGGMGGNPMGGYGRQIQGVPIGFGVTTS